MSTRIETLPQRPSQFWPVVVIALFVALTVATIATSLDRPERAGAPASEGIVAGLAGGVAVNTPSELAGSLEGIVGGTAANTPSELSGGIAQDFVGGATANTPSELSGGIRHKFPSGTAANTPTELSGGSERYLHQRI